MAFTQPSFDLLPSPFFWGPANFRLSLLCKSPISSLNVLVSSFLLLRKSLILISSFAVLVSSFLLLVTSHWLALPAPSLDEGSVALGPLIPVPVTPLESALTSHRGGGGVPLYSYPIL